MKQKLNNKGFTLIEVLAVIVILSVLMAIMIPSVGTLIQKNKEDSYESLKKSIISATKIYLSDNRYEVVLNGTCQNPDDQIEIISIRTNELQNSKLPIQSLVDAGNIKVDKNNEVLDPRNSSKKLNLETSYIVIKYQCNKKDYVYTLEDSYLSWQ